MMPDLNNVRDLDIEGRKALQRLLALAKKDTGGSARAANFLLSWWNAGTNGGFDPCDLWGLDWSYVADILTVLAMIKKDGRYPEFYGLKPEFESLVYQWRLG